MSIRRLATGLVAVPALLLSALAVPSLVASASPEAATTAHGVAVTTAASGQLAVGDPRDVTEPRLPAAACATLPAQLPGGTRIFSAGFPAGLTLRSVHFDATDVTAQYANITLDNTNLVPSGPGVTDTTVTGGPATPVRCPFPPFPGS